MKQCPTCKRIVDVDSIVVGRIIHGKPDFEVRRRFARHLWDRTAQSIDICPESGVRVPEKPWEIAA